MKKSITMGRFCIANTKKGDPRFPKKAVFAGSKNTETIVGILPVVRDSMRCKPREQYIAAGENNTGSALYVNVWQRPWKALPRLTLEDKEKMVGLSMPGYDQVYMEKLKAGHPLFPHEIKEMQFYLELFGNHGGTHIFDVTSGSGAAAMAAAVLQIPYDGLVMNQKHKDWLDRIMDKAIFAIVADSKDEESENLQILKYFKANVEEANKLIASAENEPECDEDTDDETDDNGGDGAR